jgi:hypothetical protein
MANRKVSLLWYCKTPKGWRRFPVLKSKNGRVRTGYVVDAGVEHYYPDGNFQLRTYEGRQTIFKPVGKDAAEALNARNRLAAILEIKAAHNRTEWRLVSVGSD